MISVFHMFMKKNQLDFSMGCIYINYEIFGMQDQL